MVASHLIRQMKPHAAQGMQEPPVSFSSWVEKQVVIFTRLGELYHIACSTCKLPVPLHKNCLAELSAQSRNCPSFSLLYCITAAPFCMPVFTSCTSTI